MAKRLRTDEELEALLSRALGVSTKVRSNFDVDAVNKMIEDLKGGVQVHVGIFDDKPDLAAIAVWNEYGTSRIPARPFMRSTLDRRSAAYDRQMEKIFTKVMTGKVNVLTGLATLGKQIAKDISNSIDKWKKPPNAISTIKKKGFNDPLVETGELMNSIEYRVIQGKSE
jgi:hypothetical protein